MKRSRQGRLRALIAATALVSAPVAIVLLDSPAAGAATATVAVDATVTAADVVSIPAIDKINDTFNGTTTGTNPADGSWSGAVTAHCGQTCATTVYWVKQATFTAADGSTLTLAIGPLGLGSNPHTLGTTAACTVPVEPQHWSQTDVVSGGTGRFAGATGTLTTEACLQFAKDLANPGAYTASLTLHTAGSVQMNTDIGVKGIVTARHGYWMVDAGGTVYPFGNAQAYGSAATYLGTSAFGLAAVDLEPTPTGNGYWIVDNLGRVYAFGDAAWLGNLDRTRLSAGELAVSLSATPDGKGYWIVTNLGRVAAIGSAKSYGELVTVHLNQPIVSSVATPTGLGYYLVAGDGGIFAFGDAVFRGSMGGTRLNAPVHSIVPTLSNGGYWLVASDGGVFAFGDAVFRGSMGGTRLNAPIVSVARFDAGYLMAGRDGGVFNFSDYDFAGSLGASPPSLPIVAVAVLPELLAG